MRTNNFITIKFILFTLLISLIKQTSVAQCNIEVSAEIVNCSDALNTFNALVSVTGTGVGNTFVLGGDGITFGSFSYNSSPIEIGPFTNDGSTHHFSAIDNTTLTCFGEAEILPYDFCPIECAIEIIDVEFQVCDSLDRYANIYIENNSNVGQAFTLLVNQVSQGNFLYGEDFYTIGPLDGDCEQGIGITIFDSMHMGCSDFYWQPGPWCCPDECSINDIIINTFCVEDEIAGIIVDFNYNGASNEQFEILMDSIPVDTSWVYEFPDTIFYSFIGSVPDTIIQGFGVSHVAKPNCGFYDELIITCNDTPPCEFSNFIFSPITCDGDNTYSLGLDFQVQSATSIFFDVYSQGIYLGAYQYADLPVVIDNFPAREVDYDIITICDNGNNSCCETLEFMGLDCDDSCEFSEMLIEAEECNEDGLFNLSFHFEASNGSEEGFLVRGNGVIYDTFQYNDDGFYTLGPLAGDCETLYEFIAIDLTDPDCSTVAFFDEAICCESFENCELSNLNFDGISCEGNHMGFYYSFDYQNTTNDFYDLFSNDQFIGYYEFTEGAVYVEVPVSESDTYVITICENDNPHCCISNSFEGPSCEDSCHISEFFIEMDECNDDGFFDVALEFIVSNPTSNGFTVFGDGNNYGSFEYGQTYYTVGPFEGDCQSVYEFIVVDNENQECSSNYLFLGPICCDQEECSINDLQVTPIECIEDNFYSVSIDFHHSGATNDFFDVIVENEIIGFYALQDLPVVLNYPASGNEFDFLSICINDNSDCCGMAEFEALDCNGNSGECAIFEVFAEAYECSEDGNFLVDIAFNVQNGSQEGFEIRGNGIGYGEFHYGEDFYTIGPLDGDCETIYEFIVIDLIDSSCFGEYVFEEPICCDDGESCVIFETFAEAHGCDENGNFLVDIEFEVLNPSAANFEIIANGQSYGTFQYGDNYYTFGPLEGDCQTTYEIAIIDLEDQSCIGIFEFEEPICCDDGETCAIFETFAEAHECDEDGNFHIDIAFDVFNGSDEGFQIIANEMSFGEYQYGENYYTFGPLTGDCETIYEIEIIDLQNSECAGVFEFDEPICCEENDLCQIDNIEAEIINCDSTEGVFFLSISFDYQNNLSPFFSITGNGQEYGAFGYGQENYTLGPLLADGETEYEFVISDLENNDCNAFIEFGTVDCGTTGIYDLASDLNITAFYHNSMIRINNPDQFIISELMLFNLDGKCLLDQSIAHSQSYFEQEIYLSLNGIYVLILEVNGKYHSLKIPVIK